MLNAARISRWTLNRRVHHELTRNIVESASNNRVVFGEHPPLYLPEDIAKLKPPLSPAYYSSRPSFSDHLHHIEKTAGSLRLAMRSLQLTPVPLAARKFIPQSQPAWLSDEGLTTAIGSKLNTARTKQLRALLLEMEEFRTIASLSGELELATNIAAVLSSFQLPNKVSFLNKGKAREVKLDQFGRSYTVGKRKNGSARVWVIPTQRPKRIESAALPESVLDAPLESVLDVPSDQDVPVATSILVNSMPINQYFQNPRDRERVIRPLKLTGLLGAFNVFCIVRGGGLTGQSGAVANGLAKGLAAQVPNIADILSSAKLIRRDSRMVERKKTGRAKARKAYQWVKR